MRICFWDLETWDLSPEFGPIVCASVYSEPEGEMMSFRQDEYVAEGLAEDSIDDRQLCVDLRDHLEAHDLLCAYYGKGFDAPLLRTRLAKYEEDILEPRLWIDPIYYFKGWRGLDPQGSSLEKVAKFLPEIDEEKYEMKPDEWLRARMGTPEFVDKAVERCESDVRLLKKVTDIALKHGLIRNVQMWP